MAAQASKWSPLQKADCIFTWPKNCSKMTSLQKASASNMIYTYHYLSAMTGEPAPFFSIKQLVFSALYGTQAPSKRRGNLNGDQHGDCWASTKCLPNAGAVSSLQKSIMKYHDLMNPKMVSLHKFTGILTCPRKSQQHVPTKVNWCYLLVCKMVYLQKWGIWGTFSIQNPAPTAFCIGLKASMFVVEIGTGINI